MAERLAHGQRIGRRRCYEATIAVKRYWSPHFPGRQLAEITRDDIKDLGMVLKDAGLAAKTVNNALEFGAVALRWAHQNRLIPTDPTAGVRRTMTNKDRTVGPG